MQRLWQWLVLWLIATTALTACTSSEESESTDTSTDFTPVTINHALGAAEITQRPQRVVTLGQGSAETAIALGVIPVAIEEYSWGADDTGYLPWIREAVEAAGAELPAQFAGGENLSPEQVAGYEPDLILAPWSGITQEQYDQLSAIAPTVAYEEYPWTILWQDQIHTVATALGHADAAPELIAGIEQEFAAASRPEYRELTFSYIYNTGPDALGVFMPTEQRVEVVSQLGFTVDPVVQTLEDDVVVGTDAAPLSPENLHLLADADLIFTFYSDEENSEVMHQDALYQFIPAIARGSEVAPTDQSLVTASSMINPLTVPWFLPQFTELIDAAVAQVP